MTKIIAKFLSFLMAIWTFICPLPKNPEININKEDWNTNYAYIYVHGLSGWGSYDIQYKFMPYWGMFGGNLLKFLNKQGFDCYAASVAPQGSAWDRACELYAQLTGTVTDYGEEHSARCGHDRFGPDFTGRALIENWSSKNKINLIGHSFGGATVRMLVSLMAEGSEAEQGTTAKKNISPLFTGGKASWIYSVITLAAPHNGTTAYGTGGNDAYKTDADKDSADYDMHIDNALELNKNLALPKNVYYFSISCSSTVKNDDGTYSPVDSKTEFLFRSSAEEMGHLTGKTAGGVVIDKTWLENDGLVNTCSALYPMGQPHKTFNPNKISKGTWNVMPVYDGDHMSLQGGLFVKNDVRAYHAEMLNMINSL